MARRFRYGINFEAINSAKFWQVLPLGYHEVVPGDTYSGKVTTRLTSDTATQGLLNRAYLDTYAFYVPYRVLWEEWPDFVANIEGAPSIPPVVADAFPQNFENGIVGVTSNAFQRYAYNMIYNKFFRPVGDAERALDATGLGVAAARPSTLFESILDAANVPDTDVDVVLDLEDGPPVSGTGSVSIQALREGFAADRFQKVRDWYGSKYTDYLAALGVEATWSVLDEPEVIGMNHSNLRFAQVSTTADAAGGGPAQRAGDNVGDLAGRYDGTVTTPIRRTFVPEHGLIVLMGAARLDTQNVEANGTSAMGKFLYSDYWSPEFETERLQAWPNNLIGGGLGTDTVTPRYEDLRKGTNQLAVPAGVDQTEMYYATFSDAAPTQATYRKRNPDDYDTFFRGFLGAQDASQVIHFQTVSNHRCTKQSPVKPDNASHGVS